MTSRPLALLVAGLLVAGAACSDRGDGEPDGAATRSTDGGPTSSATASTSTTPTTAAPTTTSPPEPYVAGQPFACPPTPSRALPDPSRPRHDVEVVVAAMDTVTGVVRTRFTPDLWTDRLVYRLWPNGPRPEAGGGRLSVGSVVVDGRERVAALHPSDDTRLEVGLDPPLEAGQTAAIELDFALDVPGAINDRYASGPDWLRLGSFLPSLEWQPGIGWNIEPPTSGFAESSVQPVADFTLAVQVPEGFDVLASGVEVSPGRFDAPEVRDVALSVGRFRRHTATANAGRPVEVEVGVLESLGSDPQAFAAKIVRSLEDFAARYGPYPWPRYSLSITPELSGGIEYPMHVLQGPDTGGRTTSHEVAHMWFYGLVGNHQGVHPWLDEGLASWAEAVFESTLPTFVARSIPAAGRGHLGASMTYWESHSSAYYRSVYVQGAQALAALGPVEVVDCILRHHVAGNAHRIATPADFVRVAEALVPTAGEVLARYGVHT